MTNIAEILKNAPDDLKLYSPICGYVELDYIKEGRIGLHSLSGGFFCVDEFGRYEKSGECLLFPSKEHRTWDNWFEVIIPQCVGSVFVVGNDKCDEFCLVANDKKWIIYKDGKGFTEWIGFSDLYLCQELRFATPEETEECFKELNKQGWKFEDGEVVKKKSMSWTILDAKDGDFVYDNKCDKVFIFKKIGFGDSVERHAAIDFMGNWSTEIERPSTNYSFLESNDLYGRYRLATEKEIGFFLEKLNEAGYHWNPLSKHLLKRDEVIEKKFTINDFKPFDKVLARDERSGSNWCHWIINLFSYYVGTSNFPYKCLTGDFAQCIPYNEETVHLLGTTENYDGPYKTWEE